MRAKADISARLVVASIGQCWWAAVLPVPDHPAVIDRWRSIGVLEPSDALGQHDFFGKHRTVGEQMRSASRVVEVRAQEHCDYASIVKVQRAFDELSRQSIGSIGDDRGYTRLRCLTEEVHALSDVASDRVETSSCRSAATILPLAQLAPKLCR